MRRARVSAVAFVLVAGTAGCDLTDVTLVDFTDVVVAEVFKKMFRHFLID
jgi:hypothetical protein